MKKRKTKVICAVIAAFLALAAIISAFILLSQNKNLKYSVNIERTETVSSGDHNRNISLSRFEGDSVHEDEINSEIFAKYEALIDEYMSRESNEMEYLRIETSCFEIDDVLCIAVIADTPHLTTTPLVTSCIYLDLRRDVLYSTDEYLQRIGVDKESLCERLSARIAEYYEHDEYEIEIENAFYTNGDLFLVLQITDEDGARAAFTALYNYNKDSFHFYRDAAFKGFKYLKEYIEDEISTDDPRDPTAEKTYTIEGEKVIFTEYEGYESPIGWESFLQDYESGELGDIKISELTVGDAVMKVEVKPSEKSQNKYSVYLTSVTAFEYTYTFDEPLYLLDSYLKAFWGGKYINCFLFFYGRHGVGETVIFDSTGMAHLDTAVVGDADSFEHSDDIITEFFLRDDGELGYIKTYRKYRKGDTERKAGILRYCLGEDEFCREQGRVIAVRDGDIVYYVENTESVGEVYNIESYFKELHAAWRYDFAKIGLPEVETLDELIEYNRTHYKRGGDISAKIEDDLTALLNISYGELKNSGFKLGYRGYANGTVYSLYNYHGILLKYTSNLWNEDIPEGDVPCAVIITNNKYTPYGLSVGMTGMEAKNVIPQWDDVICAEMEDRYYTLYKLGDINLFAGWSSGDIASLGENYSDIVKNEPVGVLCEIVLCPDSSSYLPSGVRIENETVYFDTPLASLKDSFFTMVDLIAYGMLSDTRITRFAIGGGIVDVEIEPYSVEEFFSVSYGIMSPSISAYGQSVTFDEPMSLYGNLSAIAFDTDEHFFFTNYYYSFGITYILSRDGVYKQICNVDADPYVGDAKMMNRNEDGIPNYNVPIITFDIDNDGKLFYERRAAKYVGWQTVGAPLAFSVGGDELYVESGSVHFDGIEPILIPEESITFEEALGRERLESFFNDWFEYCRDSWFIEEASQANTLDELFEINAKNFERFK